MKNSVIYDPSPVKNDYLTPLYFESLYGYMRERGIQVDFLTEGLLGIRDKNILINAQHLTPEIITKLKNSGNSIFSFDINDSSWPCDTYSHNDAMEDINVIFKVSGIQDTQVSENIVVNDDFTYSTTPKVFLEGEHWERFDRMNKAGRLLSLPYGLLNSNSLNRMPPYEERSKTCLIRGGNHYLRFNLFLNLLRQGLMGLNSGFLTSDYFEEGMNPQFRYCDDCRSVKRSTGKVSINDYAARRPWNCNRAGCDLIEAKNNLNDCNFFNNRCVPLFYWITEQFEKTHGPVDKSLVENALNSRRVSETDLMIQLALSLFYGDFKWIFSIYAPPRFWEAARTKTISLVPAFTKDQTHFPEIKENEHYIAYSQDFSDINKLINVTKEQYDHITNNCFSLYNEYIKGDRYKIGYKLMDHIISKIDQFA